MDEDSYVAAMLDKLETPRGVLADDGTRRVSERALAHKKYRLLRLAYLLFIMDLAASPHSCGASARGRHDTKTPLRPGKKLKPGDPDYEFPKEVHNLLVSPTRPTSPCRGWRTPRHRF
jgi:hypothetical protein